MQVVKQFKEQEYQKKDIEKLQEEVRQLKAQNVEIIKGYNEVVLENSNIRQYIDQTEKEFKAQSEKMKVMEKKLLEVQTLLEKLSN